MPAFDSIATSYDRDFTQSLTGLMQRGIVHDFLEKSLPRDRPLQILELGCGTGEDALFLARRGHRVTATDLSEGMIAVAKAKAAKETLPAQPDFRILDMRRLVKQDFDKQFDLVFSNFGAMNCLSPADIRDLFESIKPILRPEGRFIGVVMPRFCTWESFYFFIKWRWKMIFRRQKKDGIMASLDGAEVKTWYYSPRQLRKLAGSSFYSVKIRPVGCFLPPSYLDRFFSKRKGLLGFLGRLEKRVANISFLSGCSDHLIFEMKRKE